MRELDTVALIPYCPSEGGGEPIVGKESLVLQKAFWITAALDLCWLFQRGLKTRSKSDSTLR